MKYKIAVIGTAFEDHHIDKMKRTAEEVNCDLSFYPDADSAMRSLSDVDILFAASNAGSPEVVKAAPQLKWFASYFAGVDPLISSGVMKPETLLTNGSGAYGVTIAEHMIMVTLMMMRRYPEYHQFVKNQEFRSDLMIGSIFDATVIVCGTGDIGSHFARRLRAFSPRKIVGVNRSGRPCEDFDLVIPMDSLDQYLPEADILALCLPGTPHTNDLISRQRLNMLKSSAFVINVGRGNCLDQDAVIEMLNSGALAGAALDVFRTEPIPQNDPAWNTPGLLVTPHCSGKMTMAYTRDTLVDSFCENLKRFCRGEQLHHLVDREFGY